MKIRLAYGREGLEVDVPEKNLAKILTMQSTPPLAEPLVSVKESLLHPIGCPPLGDLVRCSTERVHCCVRFHPARTEPAALTSNPRYRRDKRSTKTGYHDTCCHGASSAEVHRQNGT